ncbi:Thymidine kinase (modular protein) [Candidatus Hydrogenisulfobacillus filiaventi]|uniref:Thymidine kinase n=1 Tax=Candidatus Hydrogenisulfobacillus filiaventi TaxID=2707344 RepID=A0A6F8ZI08_9FIRM|nr:Thymidine kinase (modular protein) [Candidatus Hydrogenisulfobacillus filiaventi]
MAWTGPMWAGKTTALARSIADRGGRWRIGVVPWAARPQGRDLPDRLRGLLPESSVQWAPLPDDWDPERDPEAWAEGVDGIALDEAQFAPPSWLDAIRRWRAWGLRVHLAGLSLDALGRPFGTMPSLLAAADEIIVLHARCARCGRPARDTALRPGVTLPEDGVAVGDGDRYVPLCPRCWAHSAGGDSLP